MNQQEKSHPTDFNSVYHEFLTIKKIKHKQKNDSGDRDWGVAEQKAYERILSGSTKNVSGKEFLSWLSELKQKRDIGTSC